MLKIRSGPARQSLGEGWEKITEQLKEDLRKTREELTIQEWGTEKTLEGMKVLVKELIQKGKEGEEVATKDKAILASVGDGLVVVDKEGKILTVNNAFENLVGWKGKEVLGKLLVEVVPREDETGNIMPFNERILTKVLSSSSSSTTTTTTWYYTRKDKTRFPAASIITPFILEGKIIGAVEVFRDITREKEIDKAKTEFISLASHQLRTPLAAVRWYSEMLLADDVGKLNKGQKKYLNEVYDGTLRMVDLVNAILNVSRIELGVFAIRHEPTNVVLLMQEVIAEQKPQIDMKKLKFSSSFEKNIPIIQADPKLLHMVVQNLLSNAVKYTPEDGAIEVSLSLDNIKKALLIKVADTGWGIPKHQQDTIYDKFFRADNVRQKDTEGTGLGLYIVKSIMDNSGGKIWFESEENKGTTFYVTLPLDGMKKKEGTKALS